MARRGAGEGNIYRRADGRWVARLHLGYAGGRRMRKHYYGVTRREVADKLARAKHDLNRGLPVGLDGRQTLESFLHQWLRDVVKVSVRPSTYTSYELHVRRHIVPELGRVALTKLSAQQVQALLNRKLASGLSPRSVHHLRAVLRRALNQAMRWDLVPRNVATLVDPPRVPAREAPHLTPAQVQQLLTATRGDRLHALFTLTVATGLRQGEALALRWSDLDLEAGTVSVRHTLQRIDGELRLVEPQSTRGRRTIPVPASVAVELRAHRLRQKEERIWMGSRWQEGDFVFTTTIGTPLDGSNVTHRLQELLARAGLHRIRFHDLRHTAASLMLQQGTPARVVMEILGHSQISLTLNTYSHVIPSLMGDAADRMDLVFAAMPGTLPASQTGRGVGG
jgi:integrase